MKICIIDDADPSSQQFPYVPEKYLEGHTWEKHLVTKGNAVLTIKQLATKGFDVFLNLCCGAFDEDSPGIEVVQALERFDCAFTGADQLFYEPTRESMKMVCEANGLAFPKGVQIRTKEEVFEAVKGLKFPLLVKHSNSYASVGLTPQSKVENEQELLVQVNRMLELFGTCLVEEFIDGKEYSVLIAENPDNYDDPVVFTPIEVVFAGGETFKHESLKWVDYNKISTKPVFEPELKTKLEYMGKIVFTQLHGTGYGRCDIRCDQNGVPHLLEINPNGAVFYPKEDPGTADHILQLEPDGHNRFMDLLLRSALSQREKRRRGFEVRYRPTSGFGLYATKNYEVGAAVISLEQLPHQLISRAVLASKTEEKQERVFATSFPLSDTLFYTPAYNPEEWHPINHSCDPSLWFEPGTLMLIARRAITAGEELSLDYGMLFTEELPSFDCPCGTENCRKVIRGSDYKLPECINYGNHRSPYILSL